MKHYTRMKIGILSPYLLLTIGWAQIVSASTNIKCEIPALSRSTNTNQYLVINSEKNEKFDVKIESNLDIMDRNIVRYRDLSPGPKDHFTPSLVTPSEIRLKYLRRFDGKNLKRLVNLNLDQRRGQLIQNKRRLFLENCEID